MNQVINSHRVYVSREGIYTPARNGMTTTEGATRRASQASDWGRAKSRARRLSPGASTRQPAPGGSAGAATAARLPHLDHPLAQGQRDCPWRGDTWLTKPQRPPSTSRLPTTERRTRPPRRRTRPKGDEAALGDPGKRALDAMKAERNAARANWRTSGPNSTHSRPRPRGARPGYAAERGLRRCVTRHSRSRTRASSRPRSGPRRQGEVDRPCRCPALRRCVGVRSRRDGGSIRPPCRRPSPTAQERPGREGRPVPGRRRRWGSQADRRPTLARGRQAPLRRAQIRRNREARAEGRLNSILGAK